MENLTKKTRKLMIDKINKLSQVMENISKFNKRRAFNKAVGPGKRSKINKRRA